MPPLLSFLNVSKRYADGEREITVLDCVSLEVEAGVSVGILGARRSGKSTLLRLAAGIELADSGSVRFDGGDMGHITSSERACLLRGEIGFMSAADWRATPGQSVIDHVATPLGNDGLAMREARRRAMRVLDRVEIAATSAEETTTSLSLDERARVMLARALAREPRLLILDEPAPLRNLGERDSFNALLRAAAHEGGITLLMGSEEIVALQGVSVMMSIADGELVSTEPRGVVLPLRGRRRAGAAPSGQ
jgi:ABC-type lipoprotein export system ATPase subunit